MESLAPLDHEAQGYEEFAKDFYTEAPELAAMSEQQVHGALRGVARRGLLAAGERARGGGGGLGGQHGAPIACLLACLFIVLYLAHRLACEPTAFAQLGLLHSHPNRGIAHQSGWQLSMPCARAHRTATHPASHRAPMRPPHATCCRSQVRELRAQLEVRVAGYEPPKPVTTFRQCGFEGRILAAITKAG